MRQLLLFRVHPSWSFYACVLGFITGVAISLLFGLEFCFSPFVIAAAFLVLIISLWKPSRLACVLAFIASFSLANFRLLPDLTSRSASTALAGTTLTLTGTVINDPEFSSDGTVVHLSNLSSPDPDLRLTGTVYAKLSGQPSLERSDIVTLRGKFGSSFGTYLGSFYRPDLLDISRSASGDVFARFKNFFADRIRVFLPSPESDLGLGYLMGIKSGLSTEFSEALRTVGMTHVIVASGTHLGILVAAAKRLFGKISRFAGVFMALLMIAFFVLIVGFTPSMMRAGLVAALSLLFGYVGRKFTPLRLILLVAALTLLITPLNFLNLGWQLSFCSFFGILIFAPALTKLLYGGKRAPWLASMLITSVSTTLICAPVLIYNFGSISLLSLVANLFILPTLPFAMLLLVLVGTTSFLPWLANLFALPAKLLLDFHISLVNFLSRQSMFVLNLPSADLRIFLLFLPLLAFLFLPKIKKIYYNMKHDYWFRKRDACTRA